MSSLEAALQRIRQLEDTLTALGYPRCTCHPIEDDSEHCLPSPAQWLAERDREVAAKTLREYAETLNLHGMVPDDDDLAYLCEDDECLWWDMTYAEQERIRERADRIEKGENRG